MKVMKFGGTSLAGASEIKKVAEIIKRGAMPRDIIIVSAMGSKKRKKITDLFADIGNKKGKGYKKILDEIIDRHKQVINKLGLEGNLIDKEIDELRVVLSKPYPNNLKWLDHLMSFGERMMVKIVAFYLNKIGFEANNFNAYEVGMITNSNFGNASPLPEAYRYIKNSLKKHNKIAVITGFIGMNKEGKITTLGRGGSDYSAAIFAAALDAERLEIWSDVDGIMTANPKVVKNAMTIEKMSYEEAKELAYYGAKLHPKTIWPAMEKNIPVYIFNTFNPSGKYTMIVKERIKSSDVVKGIICKKNNYLITISSPRMIDEHGFLASVFDIFGEHKTSVDMLSTSEANLSITTNNQKNIKKILKRLKLIDSELSFKLEKGRALIYVVGEGMKHTPGVAGRIFSILGKNRINIEAISQGASEISIGFIVDDKCAEKIIRILHKEYFG